MKQFYIYFYLLSNASPFSIIQLSDVSVGRMKDNSKISMTSISNTQEFVQCLSSVEFNIVHSAIAGSAAGGFRALSRGLTYPFDSMKTFEQVVDASEVKKKGFAEYFRGVTPTVLTAVPANAFFFITYDYLMSTIPCLSSHSVGLLERLIVSSIATIPQNLIKIPAELIKQRAQVQSESDFMLIISQITKTKGLSGLYLGGGAMLLREIPYNAFQMASFAYFKESIIKYNLPIDTFDPVTAAVLGLFAAALAVVLTQPADVVKTRIMTDLEEKELSALSHLSSSNQSLTTTSISNTTNITKQSNKFQFFRNWIVTKCFLDILREEGVSGLFVGMGPRLALASIGGMVYFWAAALADQYYA